MVSILDRRSLLIAGTVALLASVWWTNAGRFSGVQHVTVQEAKTLIDSGAVVVDVRSRGASAGSHVPNAILIPLDVLAANLVQLEAHRASQIVVYCNDGVNTGPEATKVLNEAGFSRAVNLKSGIEGWRAAGLPTKGS